MDSLVNKIKQTTLSVAEQLTPVLRESKFKESGRITPEEFVAAGDHLIFISPTWQWMTGDEAKIKSYLPRDKQFLVTKNVPCLRRCKQMEFTGVEKIVEDVEGEDGWVTHETDDMNLNECAEEMTLDSSKMDDIEPKNEDEDDDDQEALDMEEFDVDNVDPSVAIIKPTPIATTKDSETDSVIHTRTYDLHIVYNKYYQTPHLFLIGYDENRQVLNIDQMYEDVSQDNAKKTVTYEAHPHLGPSMLAVHPCKHSDLMKKFLQIAEEGGNELSVYSYLIIFLKFVQSVIPTVNYDFSQTIKTT
ncbi:hypothetical protein PVAND_014593 [Polypedilum vanderplanki]|uniref:Ubiquitin-like-conjugating enzyme ATG3 n=1 Tax=Polypedilum vanderplanki TaxID=319348 RepID=A0A9J6BA71_POLVA|nr:hypothetical protein PVAND_014593 [Polypedilum vanderplanki]